MMHEARTDCSMLLWLMFLFLVDAGAWRVDAVFPHRLINRETAKANTPTIGGGK
jgi:hypothetical protein